VRKIIGWLGNIHARILSDQSPLPPLKRRFEGDDAIRNILDNQICLLPPKSDNAGNLDVTSVDNIIVCGSEVLERYYKKPSASAYIQDIVQICHDGAHQPTNILQSNLRARVEIESRKDGFHHILTELALLEVRKSVLSQSHGMVPVVLSQVDPDEAPMRYLPIFYNTDVKLKLKSPESGSLHKLFFKLLEQLFPNDRDFIGPFKECYNSVTSALKLDYGAPVAQGNFDIIVNPGILAAYQKSWKLCCAVVRDNKLQAYTGNLSSQVSQVLHSTGLQTRHEILKWLSHTSAPELHGRFDDSGTRRIKGTCDWVIKHEKFQQWYCSKGSDLIILCGNSKYYTFSLTYCGRCAYTSPPVGTGKTYCTSRVVDWVQKGLSTNNNDEAFAYFYCNKQDLVRREPKEILRCIIRQLSTGPWRESEKGQTIHKTVYDLWKKSQNPGISSTFALWEECLLELIDTYPMTTIVLDAFDECEKQQRKDLLKFFVDLASRGREANPVKIFISARPEEDVLAHFQQYPMIRLEEDRNADDIAVFARKKMAEHSRWSKYPEDFQAEVIQTLLSKSGNMFLLVSLQVQQLLNQNTLPALRDCLHKLPDRLQEIYEEIYQKATSHPDERKLLDRALQWVMCSAKPLTTDELLLAICQDSESNQMTGQRQDIDEDLILKWSQNLMYLDVGESIPVWRLAHQAVAEFLEKSANCNSELGHSEIGKVCLAVLLFTFGGDPAQSGRNLENDDSKAETTLGCPCPGSRSYHYRMENSLMEYATWAWPTHVRAQKHCKGSQVAGLSQKVQEFLGEPEKGTPSYNRWMEHAVRFAYAPPFWSIFRERLMPGVWRGNPRLKPISLACYLGLYNTLAEWCDQFDFDYNCVYSPVNSNHDLWWRLLRGFYYSPHAKPFRWSLVALACIHDEIDILKHLLDRGAHINPTERNDAPPIVVAAGEDSVKSAKELIERGCEIDCPLARANIGILAFALSRDSLKFIELLLSQVLLEPLDLERRLEQVSCQYWDSQSSDAMNLVLDKGVNVDTPLKDGTFLAVAANKGWGDCVRRLLDKGADVNTQFKRNRFGNALEAAVEADEDDLSIAHLLIENGARVTLRAIGLGAHRRIGALVEKDEGEHELMQRLIMKNEDLNEIWRGQDGSYTSALVESVKAGNLDYVRCLILHGAKADLNVGGRHGNALSTALLMATAKDWVVGDCPTTNLVRVLRDAGATLEAPEARSDRLNWALASAAYAGLEDAVEFLLDQGVSPDAFCAHEWTTALGAAAASQHARGPHIVQMLLERGANVNAYFPANVGDYLSESRLALDWPFYKIFFPSKSRSEGMQNSLRLALVLLSHGAIWDVNFARWREKLEERMPEFARWNSKTLDQILQMLQENRTRFFLTNPAAASYEQWRIKDSRDKYPNGRDMRGILWII
jgi:ankyrin repeat protein